MESTPELIKQLRERTGCPVAVCKEALLAAGQDLAAAQALLLSTGKYQPDTSKSWSWDALQQGCLDSGGPHSPAAPTHTPAAEIIGRMESADIGGQKDLFDHAVSNLVLQMEDALFAALERYDPERDTSGEISIIADTGEGALVFAYGDGGDLADSHGANVFFAAPLALLSPCHHMLRCLYQEEYMQPDDKVIGWIESAIGDSTAAFEGFALCVYGGCDYRMRVWPPLYENLG